MCKQNHGGAAPQTQAAAADRTEQAAAAEVASRAKLWDSSAAPVKDPVAALQALAGQIGAAVERLGDGLDLAALEGKPVQSRAWQGLLREYRQLLSDMERNGISRRALEMRAADVQVLVSILGRALDRQALEAEVRAAIARSFFEEFRGWVREQLEAQAVGDPGAPDQLEAGAGDTPPDQEDA